MSWGEVSFGDFLRKSQNLRMKSKMKAIQSDMNDLIEGLKIEQIKVLGKDAIQPGKSSGNSQKKRG
jgi:hypothetical protein